MKNQKNRETLKQAVEQANQALNSVMQELDDDALNQVTGAGSPFGDVPRPDPEPIDPKARENG
jgi:hypothetical protein